MSEIDINLKTSEYVSYYQYLKGISPVKRLYIKADELIEDVNISITSRPEFLLPYELDSVTLPRRSNVSYDIGAYLSPLYLAGLEESVDGEIVVTLSHDNVEIASTTQPIRVLGYDVLRYKEQPERIATFVKNGELIAKVGDRARHILHDWKKKDAIIGYQGNTKNDIRFLIAAIYKAIIDYAWLRGNEVESDEIAIPTTSEVERTGVALPISIALIVASVLESVGLNPVIARAKNEWLVGAWLKEECFPEYIIDAGEFLTKRMAVGVNDFTIFSVEDIFGRISFEASEKRCKDLMNKHFEFAIDIRRARIGHIMPLPTKVKKKVGFDLIEESIFNTDSVPHDIEEYKGEVAIDSKMTKEKQWERRLLDLSQRNALVSFKENKNSVKIIFASIQDFVTRFDENREYTILPLPRGVESTRPFEERLTLGPAVDLLNIEMNNGKLHANIAGEDYEKAMINVYRKDKVFMEESGTNSLYLAVGFLRYKGEQDKESKYSPLFLYPVSLTNKVGNKDSYSIKLIEDEVRINSTLLEYLYQEYGLDLRGLQNTTLDADTMLAIIGRIRREIVDRVGWDIVDDIYLTNVSFSSYLMWKDVKNRIDDFRANKLIAGFIDNTKRVFKDEDYQLTDAHSDDTYSEGGIYLPLSADSSQYSAIVDSLDKSFVLHGPPGTGKSQTITNIIANNILRGRRVLFVAEKMAALSVVEKRLSEIGLGDFCLELHSNKNNKTEVAKKLVHTMSLADADEAENYTDKANEIRELIKGIEDSMTALHRPRRLGVSVYEGAMRYLENANAATSLKIEPIFYERLSADTLEKYENILTELVTVGRECGEIASSPFKYIGDVDISGAFRERAEEILDILSVEIGHIRDYAERLMELLRVRTTAVTNARLRAMYNICTLISKNSAVREFFLNRGRFDSAYGVIMSYKANILRRDELRDECLKIYDHIEEDLPADIIIDKNDKRHARVEKKTKKIMSKFVISDRENANEEGYALLERLFEVEADIENIKGDVDSIFSSKGNTLDNVRAIDKLFDSAKILYADYNEESFESIVECASGRYLIGAFARQYEMYSDAYNTFKRIFDYSYDKDDSLDIQDLAGYLRSIRDNLDLMPNWCKYNELLRTCSSIGLQFVVTPLKNGGIALDDILRSFRKSVYGNFVESELALDKTLSGFSGKTIEEKIDKLSLLADTYESLTREEMYYRMVARIPHADSEGAHNIEMVELSRAEKSNMKGVTLRNLFLDIPTIMKYACPCMLMSPVSVAQFLDMDMDKFDLVVFDEASQMPTAEAIGAIARANNVIVVGDPKQLPPTKFFSSEYKDDENVYLEDLESILDDCLALGMPERHLLWHYRSEDESLIAFSNAMYYENRLLTFPSPMELDSKVRLRYVDGVYERGGSKRNKKEAEALVEEVIKRLQDGKHMSIGIVTFNTAQQNYIDDLLRDAIKKNKLYEEAYECDEPIFVKNLENVQGDERDIILFSVGYGPDANGKLSLNFGPINQNGGYRRLNVAITRARAEMMVFTSITGNMINLSKTDNAGVKGLKAFLEYAERGRDMLVVDSKNVQKKREKGIGAYIAEELKDRGFDCEYDVGVSDFKIDVAVVDPKNKDRYILAIMCDGENANAIGSVRDRMTMNAKILKRLGWNVYYLWTINYLGNPKREIQKIRDYLMTFTRAKAPSKKAIRETIAKYKRTYKAYNARPLAKGSADYILDAGNESAIFDKVLDVIATESPIEQDLLLTRLCSIYNITKNSKKAIAVLLDIASRCAIREEIAGKIFYRIERDNEYMEFRPIDENKGKREIDEVHPFEIISAMRCILENRIKLSHDDLVRETLELIGYTRKTRIAPIWVDNAINIAVSNGRLIATPNDMYTI